MNTYGIKPNYVSRTEPAYFDDTLPDSTSWQADVYRQAAHLARQVNIKRLIDLGCGQGGKLAPYGDSFDIAGIDFGANIDACKRLRPGGQWVSLDLNKQVVAAGAFRDSVVICADVIEHLPTPEYLLQTFQQACMTAAYVLVSTPDRFRVYNGHDHDGPPGNPYHVREWSHNELETLFLAQGLPVRWSGWTISNEIRPDQVWTSLIILSKQYQVGSMPSTFEPAPHWRTAIQPQVSK